MSTQSNDFINSSDVSDPPKPQYFLAWLVTTLFMTITSAVIAYFNDLPVAFAIYFFNVSTFDGRAGLYIEDIFVRPAFRRSGIGQKLFAFLSQKAVQEGCGRIELSVLEWNEQAMQFYKKLGGTPVKGWTVFRFPEQAITALT